MYSNYWKMLYVTLAINWNYSNLLEVHQLKTVSFLGITSIHRHLQEPI